MRKGGNCALRVEPVNRNGQSVGVLVALVLIRGNYREVSTPANSVRMFLTSIQKTTGVSLSNLCVETEQSWAYTGPHDVVNVADCVFVLLV